MVASHWAACATAAAIEATWADCSAFRSAASAARAAAAASSGVADLADGISKKCSQSYRLQDPSRPNVESYGADNGAHGACRWLHMNFHPL